MRFRKRSQLPGARRARAGHHNGSHTPTSPGPILLGKMAYHTKQISRQCKAPVPLVGRATCYLHEILTWLVITENKIDHPQIIS